MRMLTPIIVLVDNLRGKSGLGDLNQRLNVLLGKVDLIANFRKMIYSNLASLLETISNLHGMNALVEKLHSLIINTATK